MRFASIRITTRQFERLVAFYEQITGLTARRLAPVFAEIVTPAGTVAISALEAARAFGDGLVDAAANRSVILEFHVEDVDREYERLRPHVADWAQVPTTMPWGNRSALFRDPDGNLVNFYTPVTEQAKERFAR